MKFFQGHILITFCHKDTWMCISYSFNIISRLHKFVQVYNLLKMNKIEGNCLDVKLPVCLDLIEQKLDWGTSKEWKTQDFEQLSLLIHQETGIVLSVTTLKRLWGKIKYDSKPNSSTLDALAQFTGAKNWRNFKQTTKQVPNNKTIEFSQKSNFNVTLNWQFFTLLCLLGIGIYAFAVLPNLVIDPSKFHFKSRKIADGLPNTVVFEYDATHAKASDKIEIQQNWDNRRRATVDRAKKVMTSTYYTPGFFKAKLVVNRQIVKEEDVFIPSNGWLGLVEQSPVPLYFTKEEIQQTDKITIPVDLLTANKVNPRLNNTWVSFYNVGEFDDLSVANFKLETLVKNEFKAGASACQKVEIILLCEGEAIISTLSIPGCISENKIWVMGQAVDGKTTDLSAFGCDFSDWVRIRWTAKDDQISFFVNDALAYQMPLLGKQNKIKGIKYRFLGTGAIKNLTLAKMID